MGRHPARRVFHGLVLVIGGVALAIVVDQLGWEGIRRVVLGTGWWFAVIAAIDVAAVMCDAFAIHGFLRDKTSVGYFAVFGAQASGLAINRLTPGNSLGEPVKVTMLTSYVPANLAVSAVVMFNLTTIYVGITAIVIGVPVTALLLDLPPRIALVAQIGTGVLIAVAIAIAVLVRRGAVGTLIGALGGVRAISADRAARWRAKIAEIDTRVRELGGLQRGLAGVLGSRLLNFVGTIVVLHAADIPLTAPLVIAMLSVGILVTWISNIIPLGLGVADGTNYALYGLLGASPAAGLVFTMVNRLRTVVLAIIGLCVMMIAQAVARSRDAAE